MLPIYLLGIVSVLNLCIAFVVFRRSARYRRTASLFVASAITVALWAIGDGLLLSQTNTLLAIWGRTLFLIAPLFTMYFLLLFALCFPDDKPIARKLLWGASVPIVLAAVVLAAQGGAFLQVIPNNGVLNTITVSTPWYGLYTTVFGVYFIAISMVFYRKLQHAKGIHRAQVWYLFFGAFFSSVLAFITNLALPLMGVGELVWMGPLFTIVYMVSYTVAIARYRLFDVRRAAGRAIAYVFSLALIALGYGLVVTVIRDWLEAALLINLDMDVYYLGLTVLALLIFPSVKQKFDALTRNIFFHNDYDVQDIIDLYGDRLTRVNGKMAIVAVVRELSRRVFGSQKVKFLFRQGNLTAAQQAIVQMLDAARLPAMNADEVDNTRLYDALHEQGIDLALRLKTAHADFGWLLLGSKANGEPYDRQDMRTMNIVTDEIAISLENTLNYEEIEEFNKTLQKKVTAATAELRDTNKKLHALDKSKDEFISMASHQLRTPLTTVKGYISMLLDGDVGEVTPQQRKVLEEAFSSSQRMVYLIGDFLNVSRLQTGKFELELQPVDLIDVVAQEVRQMEDSARSRKMTLNYDGASDIPLVSLDENKIRQVIMNFIDNAIYYSKPGDTIRISLARHGNYVSFRVIDHGIGVPAAERHKLFSKFYRASNAKKQRPDGTGIGLFMARKVVVAHGGTIIFETSEGKGSTFGFRLPLKHKVD